ncbi:Inactive receptor kinase [Quillaja saponaria]|uniref:Inactive receptor kinase n=1 Tax=Quillaja saponaria TaxID=32244 RepID=A0AAD7KVV5_QUISA|nr:Inactive receptor kinase [Quillaja saponaria]
MDRIPIWVFFILILHILPMANSEEEDKVKLALVRFMDKLAQGNAQKYFNWGWNLTSDPCIDKWFGVNCDKGFNYVRRITLEGLNLTGTLDASSICTARSLYSLSLKNNNLQGLLPEDIGKCKSLTHFYIKGNKFSGDLPDSLAGLGNLIRLDISDNDFSGELPNIHKISGLISFIAQNNNLSGEILAFDFSNLKQFNISNNNIWGQIPDVKGRFSADSFSGNPRLCGPPLLNVCPPPSPPPSPHKKTKKSPSENFVVYSGYVILGVILLLFFTFKVVQKYKTKKESLAVQKQKVAEYSSSDKPGGSSIEFKNATRIGSDYSVTSVESGMTASTLVVLTSPEFKALRFEDLLRAPAELLGRGKHGSLYKVILDSGVVLAVKRIKDWGMPKEDFQRRMHKIDQVKHPLVLPPVAFYCSQQEKLLVYEYQQNGSLFKVLHGSRNGLTFDWGSRLNVAASIAEALAYMHEELQEDGIAHGNIKSSNIIFDKKMDPCISEYGLMVVEIQDQSILSQTKSFKNRNLTSHAYSTFKVDIYAFGVILLELLTGKLVQNNGFDLANWVNSVVREEWTVEVFDKVLISEGANEERMLNLLQIALRCINPSPNDRPSMSEVAVMIITLKEEEERSITFEP